jgi:hypothetical protein
MVLVARPRDVIARGCGHRRARRIGPHPRRPVVDRIKGSSLHNLKELRPGSAGGSEVRILFVFDPLRQAVLLVAGDKSGAWKTWYPKAIADAERRYAEYLQDIEGEEQ